MRRGAVGEQWRRIFPGMRGYLWPCSDPVPEGSKNDECNEKHHQYPCGPARGLITIPLRKRGGRILAPSTSRSMGVAAPGVWHRAWHPPVAAVEPVDRRMHPEQVAQLPLRLSRLLVVLVPVRMQLADPAAIRALEFIQAAIGLEIQLRIQGFEIRLHEIPRRLPMLAREPSALHPYQRRVAESNVPVRSFHRPDAFNGPEETMSTSIPVRVRLGSLPNVSRPAIHPGQDHAHRCSCMGFRGPGFCRQQRGLHWRCRAFAVTRHVLCMQSAKRRTNDAGPPGFGEGAGDAVRLVGSEPIGSARIRISRDAWVRDSSNSGVHWMSAVQKIEQVYRQTGVHVGLTRFGAKVAGRSTALPADFRDTPRTREPMRGASSGAGVACAARHVSVGRNPDGLWTRALGTVAGEGEP